MSDPRDRARRNRFVAELELREFGAIGIGAVVAIMIFADLHPWWIWDGKEASKFMRQHPQFVESGLAIVGSCANGDYVAVDQDGRILLVSMGNTLSGLQPVGDYTVVIAPSLSALLERRTSLPPDWWEAKVRETRKRARRRARRRT